MADDPLPSSRRSRQLRGLLAGAHPALPRPLDVAAERWARLTPRLRTTGIVMLVLAVALASSARVRAAEHRWGGAPISALVATEDLAVGAQPQALRRVRLPPDALPAAPVRVLPDDAVLALALPAGAVLTRAHLDPTGPAAGLAPGLRALPVPVDEAWGITAGAWVDVWVLGGDGGAQLAGPSRPVLELRGDGPDSTALIGLAVDEVTAVTAALGQGRVLLAHAPPP
jgi:hypothetical protein